MWIDDDILARCSEPLALNVFVPAQPIVVLGAANDAAREADVEACAASGIPIVKRYGGGGTVLLHDGCVVVSLGVWVRQHYQNRFYFELVNGAVIDALAGAWPGLEELAQRGLSDLVHGDRKVGGTSLFRSRNYLLYQASLLVDARRELIARHLRHPSREPDYRAGRSHGDFIVGLGELRPGLEPGACAAHLAHDLPDALRARLGGELVEPRPEQFDGLLQRVNRN